jgi:hypothetical protein
MQGMFPSGGGETLMGHKSALDARVVVLMHSFVAAAIVAGFFKQFGDIKWLRIARNHKVCLVLHMP